MTNKSPLDRVKISDLSPLELVQLCREAFEDNVDEVVVMKGHEADETIQFALSYLEASINDVHSEDEPTSFDMLQEFMEGK